MDKKYTIKDIAALARVSRGTVDRVLNKRGKVSQNAQKRIEDVLKRIDYKPNLIARSLKNHRTLKVALLVPDDVNDLYWMQMRQGVLEASKEREPFGIFIEFAKTGSSKDSYYQCFKTIVQSKPDAVVLVPFYTDYCINLYKELQEKEIPYVLLNSPVDRVEYNSFIGQDYYSSGRTAGYLMGMLMGEPKIDEKILILNYGVQTENVTHVKEKQKGFVSYLNEKNPMVKVENLYIESEMDLLPNKLKSVQGLYITNSKSHLLADQLKENPSVKVIGYDLIPENIELLNNGTIDILLNQNPRLQGYYGVSLLSDYLLYKREMPRQKLLPIDIITKENLTGYI